MVDVIKLLPVSFASALILALLLSPALNRMLYGIFLLRLLSSFLYAESTVAGGIESLKNLLVVKKLSIIVLTGLLIGFMLTSTFSFLFFVLSKLSLFTSR
jgi:hypothetical protein